MFYIRFENRLPCQATTIKSKLPDKTFWLLDNINVKIYGQTFGCLTGINGCSGQPVNRLCETLALFGLLALSAFDIGT